MSWFDNEVSLEVSDMIEILALRARTLRTSFVRFDFSDDTARIRNLNSEDDVRDIAMMRTRTSESIVLSLNMSKLSIEEGKKLIFAHRLVPEFEREVKYSYSSGSFANE